MNSIQESRFDASEALRKTELFKCLDDEDHDRIASLVKWKLFQRGAEVISYRGKDDEVYIIASGLVRVTNFSSKGKEISYQELGPGEMFGELSAIDRLPRTANVVTLEATRIGIISRSTYWKLIERYPLVAAAALKRLASLVRFLVDRVYQYGALDVSERVRMELLRLARGSMSGEDSATIENFPTHSEIANRVNTHREAVTRELNELSRMNLIEQHQRVLSVKSVSSLADLLADDIQADS